MPKTRPIIPLNDCVLSTLRAGVEVSCEPPGVYACRLLAHLICGDVGRSNPDSFSNGVLPPD
jgi:hypothetical protein